VQTIFVLGLIKFNLPEAPSDVNFIAEVWYNPMPMGIEAAVFQAMYPPPAYVATRDQFKHEENETPSIGNHDAADEIAEWQAYLEANRDRIEQHAERRAAYFFQQLVVCYRTDFHFEIGVTEAQGESTKTVNGVRFDSAHSSTIPCLVAYSKDEWDAWVQNGQPPITKPRGFVYLKNSDTYRLHNSTISVQKRVNQADIALDGKGGEGKLRDAAIDIINRVATGEVKPQEGLQEFLVAAYDHCDGAHDVHQIYLEVFQDILDKTEEDEFFDQLLSLTLEDDDLRKRVYALRFQIIQECHATQSLIMGKINAVFAGILGNQRKPPNFTSTAKYRLIERARIIAPDSALALQKLFCTSVGTLQRKAASGKKATTLLQARQADLDHVIRDIWNDIRNLRRAEWDYRKQISLAARNAAGMGQREAAREYKELFPNRPMSQSTMSRIENQGYRWYGSQLPQEMAELYGIDTGLFFPALFTSTEQE
jgi:hypothetical protein